MSEDLYFDFFNNLHFEERRRFVGDRGTFEMDDEITKNTTLQYNNTEPNLRISLCAFRLQSTKERSFLRHLRPACVPATFITECAHRLDISGCG